MIPFEKLQPILEIMATRCMPLANIAGGYGYYDKWDLINGAWAQPGLRNLSNIKFAAQRALWDMISFIREEGKYRRQKIYWHSLNDLMGDDRERQDFIGIVEDPRREIEQKDLLKGISKRLCVGPEERLIFELWFLAGMDQLEIGRCIGLCPSRISQILTSLKTRLRCRVEDNPGFGGLLQ